MGVRQRWGGGMASVASSASLMSPLLKRSPTVDEACPPWLCFMAGESQACQQPHASAKPPLNTFTVTAPSSARSTLQFHVPAACLALSSSSLGMWGYYEDAFSSNMRLDDLSLMYKVGISGILVY